MSCNQIKISTNRLNSDAQQLAGLIQSMKKELNNMNNSVAQLNAMWDGPSKKAFVKAFENDKRALEDVIESLNSIQKYEMHAKTKYEQCENQVADLVSGIRI